MIRTFEKDGVRSEALFSKDEKYRYTLVRVWDSCLPRILFVGLNPSTADEVKNDPTVTRMMNYAKLWGYGSLSVGNAFAFRATFPEDLFAARDPIGTETDRALLSEAEKSQKIILAWGNHATFMNRSTALLKLFERFELFCLGKNSSGEPKHPLYLKKTVTPIFFN